MRMRTLCIFAMLFCSLQAQDDHKAGATNLPFQNPDLPMDQRVNDLVSRMTLEEKVKQMMHQAPAIERLGIPEYNWWNECLHGVARAGLATVFPQAIGLGAMFDDEAMFRLADVISTEARAKHHEATRKGERGQYQGLTFWSPNINIFRDPRWGRGQETYGEDPYLMARCGVAFVKGLQGNDPDYFKVIATAKHYAVHSGPEPIRHEFDARISERDLRETYLPAFEALVREAGAYSVMCAYNRFDGEPCCGSDKLLVNILRKEWGFQGYVVSDCWAINDFWGGHKFMPVKEEAVACAVKSGTDLECGESYIHLLESVKKGLITEAEIDVSLKRLMTARMKLGMFDPPERVPYTGIPFSKVACEDHRNLALEIARKSIVLLRNENNLLPLSGGIKNILVCGPNADTETVLWGNYNGVPLKTTTPLEGIRSRAGAGVNVVFEQGCDWTDTDVYEDIPLPYLQSGSGSGYTAEYFRNVNLEGAPAFTKNEKKIGISIEGGEVAPGIPNEHCSVRWTTEFTPPESGEYVFSVSADDGARLFVDDKPVIDIWDKNPRMPVVGKAAFRRGETHRLRIEFFQKSWGCEMILKCLMAGKNARERALSAARQADVVVICGGITPRLEGEEMGIRIEGFAGGDRTLLGLPEVQLEFLKALKGIGKPIVLVLLNGSALALPWESKNIPAIIEAWYGGEAGGEAIADVLFGSTNPAGRLPVTFYASENDLPSFEDYSLEGRTYRYFGKEPVYPFGHGLSYTHFTYKDISLDKTKAAPHDTITVSVVITNTGAYDGDEVVQLYVRNLASEEPQPIKSLKGFKRCHFRTMETKTVRIPLCVKELRCFDWKKGVYKVEGGKYEIQIGASSSDIRLRKIVEVKAH